MYSVYVALYISISISIYASTKHLYTSYSYLLLILIASIVFHRNSQRSFFQPTAFHILPVDVVAGLALYDALEAVVKRAVVGVKVWRLRRLGLHFYSDSIFDGNVKIVAARLLQMSQCALFSMRSSAILLQVGYLSFHWHIAPHLIEKAIRPSVQISIDFVVQALVYFIRVPLLMIFRRPSGS